jgi:cytochrome c nitrite reductase small subunit
MARAFPLLVAMIVGILTAVGGYTFIYARGYSYLTNDPQACANCHVMEDHFRAWTKSSHRAVATCNDCHTPPELVPKYVTKAINGWNHSVAFTTGRFHEPLQITPRNVDVTERACRKCHQEIVDAIESRPTSMLLSAGGHTTSRSGPTERLSCIRCHATVGHLE